MVKLSVNSFSHKTANFVSRVCTKRLWRSKVEAKPESSERATAPLRERQAREARDIYRQNILRPSGRVSTEEPDDIITLRNDQDIHAMRGDLPRWAEAQRGISATGFVIDTLSANAGDTRPAVADESSSKLVSQLDKQLGIFRNAVVIDNWICGLYITRDNVSILCQGLDHRNASAVFVISVLEALKQRCVVLESESTLNAPDNKWIRGFRAPKPASENESKIHAQFRVFYFINQEWDKV